MDARIFTIELASILSSIGLDVDKSEVLYAMADLSHGHQHFVRVELTTGEKFKLTVEEEQG